MFARYLIRLDDLSPVMNWEIWDQVERVLLESEVKPIVAVIPDNRDPDLRFGPPRPDFWDKVRAWQAQGWTIGCHGLHHRFVTANAGLVGLCPRSEFAGLPLARQREMIAQALAIFESQGVRAEVWVAPAHSFDEATLEVLRTAGLSMISDGLFLYPFRDERGLLWVPVQTWRFHRFPLGVWTVCIHPNRWLAQDVRSFRRQLCRYQPKIVDMEWVIARYGTRRAGPADRLASRVLSVLVRLKTTHGNRLVRRWRAAV